MFTAPLNTAARNILFIDDEMNVLDSIRRSLRVCEPSWHLLFASSVDAALTLMNHRRVDVVITDITMPGQDGFELIRVVAASERLKHIPVVVLTGLADADLKRRALDAGAFDMIAKPIHREELVARINSVLRTRDYEQSLTHLNATLEEQVIQRTQALDASRTDLLLCLAMAGECRDFDTGRHLIRVSRYAHLLAGTVGLSKEEVETIFKASPLHDIGKLGIPDQVLLKPAPLDASERALMQKHCETGYRILTTSDAMAAAFEAQQPSAHRPINPLLRAAANIALCHHEKWDGSGYPRRLVGEQIPISARVVAAADVYDALTTARPYKTAFTHEIAAKMIRGGSGTQFDPMVVNAFTRVENEFDQIRQIWADQAEDAEVNRFEIACGQAGARQVA